MKPGQCITSMVNARPKLQQLGVASVMVGDGSATPWQTVCRTRSAWHGFAGVTCGHRDLPLLVMHNSRVVTTAAPMSCVQTSELVNPLGLARPLFESRASITSGFSSNSVTNLVKSKHHLDTMTVVLEHQRMQKRFKDSRRDTSPSTAGTFKRVSSRTSRRSRGNYLTTWADSSLIHHLSRPRLRASQHSAVVVE